MDNQGIQCQKKLDLVGGDAVLFYDIFEPARADHYFNELHAHADWRKSHIKLFGKTHASPRLTCWYGDTAYTYSSMTWPAQSWTPLLDEIRSSIELLSNTCLNGMLGNLYRTGADSMGWHSDDEPKLGPAPVLASLSFGATRRFVVRRKDDKSRKIEVPLPGNSLLIMRGATQANWQHAIPKTRKPVGPRINLTFRKMHPVA